MGSSRRELAAPSFVSFPVFDASATAWPNRVLEHRRLRLGGGRVNGRLNGRVPRYHRIAETLRERIRGGELESGARLDNQKRLAKSFGVTLMTLRQALELLEREHLIVRRRFAGDLQAKGERVGTRLLGTRFAVPDRRVTDALGLGPRARVLVVERLRLVDGHPMSLQRSFLPPRIGDEVVRADLAL